MTANGPDPIRITVSFDVGRLAPNRRLHWTERATLEKTARAAAFFAWHTAGSPVVQGAIRVSLTVRRVRKLDPTAVLAGFRAVENGLFCRARNGWGVVQDDSAAFIEYGEIRQETGHRWRGHEEVEVEIQPITVPIMRILGPARLPPESLAVAENGDA